MESILQKAKIQKQLLRWFEKYGRDLPWRKIRDPYGIWVSEIMLQQTQVTTVIPYYQNFLKTFPTIRSLAKADLSKVLKLWEGLGYYSRARNLHRASQIFLNDFHGKIPNALEDLLSLPGIGRSTAGAILSFAFNKEAPILDGNAKRVLSRLFTASSEKRLWEISESLIPKGFSNSFNQALMDLGSIICTPKNPQCPRCPLRHLCKGFLSEILEKYPPLKMKRKIPHITAISMVIRKGGKVLLNQRPPLGLLGGLWEFPNWRNEEKSSLSLKSRFKKHLKKETGLNVQVREPIGTFNQNYSHFKLTLQVYYCQAIDGKRIGKWVSIHNLCLLPMSRIHRRIAEKVVQEISFKKQ